MRERTVCQRPLVVVAEVNYTVGEFSGEAGRISREQMGCHSRVRRGGVVQRDGGRREQEPTSYLIHR